MSYDGLPIVSITDEWVEHCNTKPNSIMLKIAKTTGILPAGVDPDDPRVIKILFEVAKTKSKK